MKRIVLAKISAYEGRILVAWPSRPCPRLDLHFPRAGRATARLPEHVDAARPPLLLVLYKHVALILAKLVNVPGQFDIHLAIIDYLLAQSRISRPPPVHADSAASALSATERRFGQSFEPDTEAQYL